MITTFEPKDFDNRNRTILGCVVRRVTEDEYGREYRNDAWLLGYKTIVDPDKEAQKAKYVRVSLSDGMVVGPMTAEKMCEDLNEGGYSLMAKPTDLEAEMKERPY